MPEKKAKKGRKPSKALLSKAKHLNVGLRARTNDVEGQGLVTVCWRCSRLNTVTYGTVWYNCGWCYTLNHV